MFQVKNLTVTHKKDLTTLIEGLSFTLSPGDRAAVIGEEGNGKSTLLRLLYDPASVEPYAEWSGEIVDQGLRKGFLAQELSPDELALPVWAFCQGVPAFEGADPKALDRAARQVGLDAGLFWDDRPMSTLSGGERSRLALAVLFLARCNLLVLDEPTAGVDPLGSRDIRNIIENLKGRGMTVFLCSHLLEQVQEVCDRVGVIFKGLLIAEGSVNELTRDSDKQEILLEHASPELMERLKEMVKEDGRAVWLEDGHPRNSLESVFLKSLLEWKEKHPNPEP